jgi:DNA/RNA endonuclease YhcR with UshA esterase domain
MTGSGIVIGPITGLGSIIVNDVEFDVADASVVVDGVAATADDLRLGMVVEVRGTINAASGTGVANRVEFDDDLQGPVEAVDVPGSTIVVLGQLVIVTGTTVFDGTTLSTLAPGDVVEVSGFVDGSGNIRATRVELESEVEDVEINGTINELDADAQTFRIGGQLVDYTTAEISDAPPGGLENGLFVEVHAAAGPVGGVLVAEKIDVTGTDFGGDEGEEVEIEGYVTRVISATEFVLNQTRKVRIDAKTQFDNGTSADIAVDARLEAEGVVDGMGVLVAKEVAFR